MTDAAAERKLARIRDTIVHERHGIIPLLFEQNGSCDAPGLYIFNAAAVNGNYFRLNAPHSGKNVSAGSGAAFDRSTALWATFGEVLERYAGSIYQPELILRDSAANLGDRAIDLDEFILFSSSQYDEPGFRYARPDKEAQRGWVSMFDMSRAQEVLVPASLVYMGVDIKHVAEEIAQGTSTGLAAGPDIEFASLRALSEVVERDASAAMWQLGFAPPRLKIGSATLSRLHPVVVRQLRSGPVKLHLWSIPTDIGLTVVVALAESSLDNVVTVGTSANSDPARAIEKSVIEALHGFALARQKLGVGEMIADEQDFSDPKEHLAFYLDPRRRHHLEFLFSSAEEIDSDELHVGTGSAAGLAAQIAAAGYRPLVTDITTDDLRDLGIVVVRAVVPGLQPLLFGRHLRSEDRRRLDRLARFWGLAENHALNTAPHPYP